MTKEQIRQTYDRIAHWYDLIEAVPELLGVRRFRYEILQRASGRVLDVAAGTGKNLRYYPETCQITAADMSSAMMEIARMRANSLGLDITFLIMDAEAIGLQDKSFDTVVSSMTLCTFPAPVAALQEMARVCRTNGRILLVEHGRSDCERLGRWQDRRADRHEAKVGCHWNREPLEIVLKAGLKVIDARRTFFGIFHLIEAMP